MTMTSSRTVTRFTAFAAALVLALSMIALATTGATGGDLQIVPASHFGDEDHGPPNDPPCERDKGAPAENNPNCDEDREKGQDRDKDGKDKDQGPPNDPPCEQGKAGEKNPNCEDDGNGKTPQEECEEQGGTWNEAEEECEFNGKTPQEECEEQGGTWNEAEEECEFNGNGAAFCPPPSGEFELEIPADPLLYLCVVLGPDDNPEDACPPPSGALEVEIPGAPLAYVCVILGPDEENGNGEENGANSLSGTLGL